MWGMCLYYIYKYTNKNIHLHPTQTTSHPPQPPQPNTTQITPTHPNQPNPTQSKQAVHRIVDATPFHKPPPRHKPPMPTPPPPPVVDGNDTDSSTAASREGRVDAAASDKSNNKSESDGPSSPTIITEMEEEWIPSESVWEHVELIAEEDSVMALWGDVTLVYLEVCVYYV